MSDTPAENESDAERHAKRADRALEHALHADVPRGGEADHDATTARALISIAASLRELCALMRERKGP